jgi:hypothetical protein
MSIGQEMKKKHRKENIKILLLYSRSAKWKMQLIGENLAPKEDRESISIYY